MKRIEKGAEPRLLSIWKQQDSMAHRPRWNRVPAAIRESVHESLMREQGFICCYCESRISMDDSYIEHFRPKTNFPIDSWTTRTCSARVNKIPHAESRAIAGIGKGVGSMRNCCSRLWRKIARIDSHSLPTETYFHDQTKTRELKLP